MSARVFIARLADVGVFDPYGDQVGKVKDVIIRLRADRNSPRAVGFVVEVPPKRRVFLPIGRATSLSASQVITTGVMNLRRFAQRDDETLVIAQLFKRRVRLQGSTEDVTILDAGMDFEKASRDWRVTQLFVQRSAGPLRLRGERFMVSWSQADGLSTNQDGVAKDQVLTKIEDLRPADVVNALQDLPIEQRVSTIRQLDDDRMADVLEEMNEEDRVLVVAALESERAAEVIEQMQPDDAADLLSELPPDQAKQFLDLMEPDEADDLRRLLTYDDYTAGGLMTTEPVTLTPNSSVAEALAAVRNPDLSPALASQVYVVRSPLETPTGMFLGVAHIQRLLRERPSEKVSSVLDTELDPVRPETPLPELTRLFATYNLVALPVVDASQRLLGAVTVDDLIDHMLPEKWRERMAVS
jgi:flagellar motility protein MotE (MotC chaperone)